VVAAEHSGTVGEHLLVQRDRFLQPPSCPVRRGQIASGGQRVRVIAFRLREAGRDGLELWQRQIGPPGLVARVGEVVPRDQCAAMIAAELPLKFFDG
jgi:hypothetical protein